MGHNQLAFGQKRVLILLRLLIGWHFLYEGALKVFNKSWTAKGYLMSAEGPFSGFFQWLASDNLIGIIDTLNVFGLFVIGLALILGVMEQSATIGGAILLMFYYLSHPPFWGLEQIGVEGNYWIVNKNLIEAAALLVLFYFPTGQHFGIQFFTNRK